MDGDKKLPQKYFEDQFDDEEVLFVFHKHPIVMRKGLVFGMFGPLIGILPAAIKPSLGMSIFFAGLAVGCILGLLVFFPYWIGWHFSVFIVTDQRFIQITQKGFFHRAVADLSLSQIQSVNYQVSGLEETLLGFGTIIMQTYVGDLSLHDVHHPAKIQKKLLTILRKEGVNLAVYPAGQQPNIMQSMKKSKIKKPNLKKPSLKPFKRAKTIEEKVSEAISEVPRITNDTVADHREDVLSSARKYIYPLRHSKHSIVRISIALLIVVIVAFLALCSLDLYDFQGTSGFIYDVTEILPFPVAKVGGSWVSYESYLFELRRNMHYYVTQQAANFSTKDGKAQLNSLKQESLNYAIQAALVNKLASENHVSISNNDVNNQLNLLKAQNLLGSSNSVFKEVLNQYYGWDINDFKRELKQEMLAQAVVAKLDTVDNARAESILKQLDSGANFSTLAAADSDDIQTKSNGGQYPSAITINDQQIAPEITNELFQLKVGQTSGVIKAGYTLDIVKVLSRNGDSLQGAAIQINLNSINTYTNPLEKQYPPHKLIKV